MSFKPAEQRQFSLKKTAYLAWLLFLATAIYAFPLYGVIYPPEGAWVGSEQFWFNMMVVIGWPIAAYFIIRWQWRTAEDPLARCVHCGATLPEMAHRCRECGHRVTSGETAELAGFLHLAQDGTRQR